MTLTADVDLNTSKADSKIADLAKNIDALSKDVGLNFNTTGAVKAVSDLRKSISDFSFKELGKNLADVFTVKNVGSGIVAIGKFAGQSLIDGYKLAASAGSKILLTGLRGVAKTTGTVLTTAFTGVTAAFAAGIGLAAAGVATLLANDSFREPINQLFEPFTEKANEAFGQLGETIAVGLEPLIPQLLEITDTLTAALGPIFDTVAEVLGSIDLGPIVTAFGQVAGVITEIIGALDLGAIFGAIDLGGIFAAFTPIIATIGELFTSLAPIISSIGQVLAGAFSDTLIAVLPAINSLLTVLADVFLTVFQAVEPLIPVFHRNFLSSPDSSVADNSSTG